MNNFKKELLDIICRKYTENPYKSKRCVNCIHNKDNLCSAYYEFTKMMKCSDVKMCSRYRYKE